MNPHHCENLNSCTKEYKEQVKHGTKGYIGSTELQEVLHVFKDTVVNSTFFSHQLCTPFSYFASQTN
jgi:hypothetical protein